jgi:hypothetical protein
MPAHGSPEGQQTCPALHDAHEVPPSPGGGIIPPPVAVPFTQRWMNGYVSVM